MPAPTCSVRHLFQTEMFQEIQWNFLICGYQGKTLVADKRQIVDSIEEGAGDNRPHAHIPWKWR